MQRTFSAKLLNEVANRPSVRPLLGGEGELDLTATVDQIGSYTFVNDHGGFIFARLFDGYYEVHTIFDPELRQPRMLINAAHEVVDRMFIETDAVELATKVLPGAKGASFLANHAGFSESWERQGVSYQNLTLDAWARSCSTLGVRGRAFHEQLEAAKDAAGSQLHTHPEDAFHDQMVGAAISMVKAGNAAKAVNSYNRWAVFAGYAPIILLQEQPILIDVRDAVVGFHDGEMEIALCR